MDGRLDLGDLTIRLGCPIVVRLPVRRAGSIGESRVPLVLRCGDIRSMKIAGLLTREVGRSVGFELGIRGRCGIGYLD